LATERSLSLTWLLERRETRRVTYLGPKEPQLRDLHMLLIAGEAVEERLELRTEMKRKAKKRERKARVMVAAEAVVVEEANSADTDLVT